jgi:sensor histidine kinase regulating citrate/malate metabolism
MNSVVHVVESMAGDNGASYAYITNMNVKHRAAHPHA